MKKTGQAPTQSDIWRAIGDIDRPYVGELYRQLAAEGKIEAVRYKSAIVSSVRTAPPAPAGDLRGAFQAMCALSSEERDAVVDVAHGTILQIILECMSDSDNREKDWALVELMGEMLHAATCSVFLTASPTGAQMDEICAVIKGMAAERTAGALLTEECLGKERARRLQADRGVS